jgi:hypothetical protein
VADFTVNTAEDTADLVVEVAKETAVVIFFIFHNFPRDYAKIST